MGWLVRGQGRRWCVCVGGHQEIQVVKGVGKGWAYSSTARMKYGASGMVEGNDKESCGV